MTGGGPGRDGGGEPGRLLRGPAGRAADRGDRPAGRGTGLRRPRSVHGRGAGGARGLSGAAGRGAPTWSAGCAHGGLALPTWLYGHEPANLFAGQIGKYFSNAVREDSILRLSRGGIVFAPGWAGTVQEVFQAATKTFYQTDGPSGAFVFLGVDALGGDLPVEALLRPLLAESPHGDQSHLIVVTDSLDEAMAALSQR